jgi:hypothetical protein
MRGQFERRLARIESRSGSGRFYTFTDDESEAFNAIARKYLGRDPTREDVRARDSFMYRITDEEEVVIVNAIKAAVRRGSALTGP